MRDCYFVGGFAAMGWVDAADYRAAAPDPLADAAAGIMQHMNADHADALVAYARHFAGAPAHEVAAFPGEVASAGQARTVLIEMLAQARAALSGGAPRP